MSYILDALKKAERERGIAKVPTLSTVHDLRARSPIRLWVVSGAVILCIAAVSWFFIFMLNPDSELKRLPPDKINDAASKIQATQMKEVDSAGELLPPVRSLESPLGRGSQPDRQVADSAAREPDVVTRGSIPSTDTVMVPGAGQNSRQVAVQELNGQPLPQKSAAPVRPEEAKSAAEAAGAKSVPLQEATADLNISILFFSENKAERLVFINGRKYVEGDIVEGKFLLESITQEGAVLNYDGKRTLLRPGSN